MQRDLNFNYDLENSPLQIRTNNSAAGSNAQIRVSLYSATGDYAGGVELFFTSPPQYLIEHCSISRTNFPTDLPFEIDNIWTLTVTRTSDVSRLILYLNNTEVLNLVISDTTCTESTWSTYWNRDVEKIMFPSADTASDYYRAGKIGQSVLDRK